MFYLLFSPKAKKRRSRTFQLLWLQVLFLGTAIALFTSACGISPTQSSYPGFKDIVPAIRLCKENRDCLDGQFCYKRYCKSPTLSKGQIVSLHLVPPSNHRFLDPKTVVTKQQYIGIDIGRLTDKRPIVMRKAYTIKGVIKTAKKGQPVPAKLRFTDKSAIKGNMIYVQAETNASGAFEVQLTHGEYQLEVTPKDGKHPTHRIPVVAIEKAQQLTFTIPENEKYPRLTGRIIAPDKMSSPIAGLTILVFSKEGKIVSSVGKTDKNGIFRMWLSAKEKPHHIRVVMRLSDPKNNVSPHPRVEIPFAPTRVLPGETIDLGNIPAGHKAKLITVKGSIKATLQDANNQEIPYSNVYLQGVIQLKSMYKGQNLEGFYRVNTTSSNTGQYRAEIIPGTYTIDVLPSSGTSHSWARASIQAGQLFKPLEVVDISLQAQAIVSGKVCEVNQTGGCKKPLPNTQVKAIWRGALAVSKNPTSLSIPSLFTPKQLTDTPSGFYKLHIDPGIYDLLFIPPPSSGFARKIYSNIRIESNSSQSEFTHNALLKSAKHLVSTVLGPDNFPIPNTIVEMYNFSHDPKKPIYLLGRATSNELGEFSLPYNLPTSK